MPISITYIDRNIFVPVSYLTLVSSFPSPKYTMDLTVFRNDLKLLEANETGMVNPDTHRHNTIVTLSGITFARLIEMYNNYTITFEDLPYTVTLTGANSNVADVVIDNQASVRSTNSAGLIYNENQAISENDLIRIAAYVWNSMLSNHTLIGSFGEFISKQLITIKKFIGLK